MSNTIKHRTPEEKNAPLAVCYEAWRILCKKLQERGYVHVGFSKENNSEYLVPAGRESEVSSWYTKPDFSFRFAENWSWYANTEKCRNRWYIQCYNVDMNFAHPRESGPDKGSSPVKGWAIGFYRDGVYHTVVGNYYDFTTGEWKIRNPKITDELIDRLLDDRMFDSYKMKGMPRRVLANDSASHNNDDSPRDSANGQSMPCYTPDWNSMKVATVLK